MSDLFPYRTAPLTLIRGTESAHDLDAGVKNFFEQCATAGPDKCAIAEANKDAKQLLADFDKFLATLVDNKSYIVRDALFNTLYFKSTTAFKDFATVLKGWYADPASVAKIKGKRDENFQIKDWKKKELVNAISGITCGDRIVRDDGSADNYKKWLAEYKNTTKYGWDIASSGQLQCSVWKQTAAERLEAPFVAIKTKHPILIVNTPWDPVTPEISARNTAASFPGSKVLISKGVGVSLHTVK